MRVEGHAIFPFEDEYRAAGSPLKGTAKLSGRGDFKPRLVPVPVGRPGQFARIVICQHHCLSCPQERYSLKSLHS